MSNLNEYFDKIFCINLDRRPDRKAKCIEQFNNLNMEVEFFSAIDKEKIENNTRITTGQLACLSSHYNVIRKAKKHGYNRILVLEDDVVISDNFIPLFFENIKDVPEDCRMLYFGGNHLNGKVKITDNVYKMVSSLTTHAYSIKSDFYDIILARLEQVMFPIDVYYAHLHREHPSYVIQDGEKQLIWQDVGYSDIDESECDYTWLR